MPGTNREGKMKKEDIKSLITILDDMKKAREFIMSEDTIVVRRCSGRSVPINKQVGSELCYLYNAVNRLSGLIKEAAHD